MGPRKREEEWAERWRAEGLRAQHTGTNQVQSAMQKLTHIFRMSDPGRLCVEQTGSFLNFKAGDYVTLNFHTTFQRENERKYRFLFRK